MPFIFRDLFIDTPVIVSNLSFFPILDQGQIKTSKMHHTMALNCC